MLGIGKKRWSDGVNESRRNLREVRLRLLSDAALAQLVTQFGLEWIVEFEGRPIQSRWCCIHRDLHRDNILRPMMDDG